MAPTVPAAPGSVSANVDVHTKTALPFSEGVTAMTYGGAISGSRRRRDGEETSRGGASEKRIFLGDESPDFDSRGNWPIDSW